jgi:hypothetical protein
MDLSYPACQGARAGLEVALLKARFVPSCALRLPVVLQMRPRKRTEEGRQMVIAEQNVGFHTNSVTGGLEPVEADCGSTATWIV